MKLIHKPISHCMKNAAGNHELKSHNQPIILNEPARSRKYKNCYVVKCGWYTYSFDSNYDYDLNITKDRDTYTLEFIRKN